MALYPLSIWLPLLLLFPLLLLMIKKKKDARRQNKRPPPSPPKLPIIGNLHQIGELPHQSLWRLSQKYGPVMLLHLGSIPTVILSSAEAAREAIKVHDLDCCSRPIMATTRRLTYNYKDMAFGPYSEYWREIRKICVLEVFSAKRVQSYRSVREEEVSLLINSISQSSSSATLVDLSEKLFSLTASITFRIAYGKSFRGSDLDNEKFQDLVHGAEALMGSFDASEYFPYVGWIMDRLSSRRQRLERVSHELDNFFQQVIDLHLSPDRTEQEHEDIIDVLLRIEREQNDPGRFTKDNIKAVLLVSCQSFVPAVSCI